MKLDNELKTLKKAREEKKIEITPYASADKHLYRAIRLLEIAQSEIEKEYTNEMLALHHNTKHVPSWIESDEQYEEWSKEVDSFEKELNKEDETANELLKMIEMLEDRILVYTEVE